MVRLCSDQMDIFPRHNHAPLTHQTLPKWGSCALMSSVDGRKPPFFTDPTCWRAYQTAAIKPRIAKALITPSHPKPCQQTDPRVNRFKMLDHQITCCAGAFVYHPSELWIFSYFQRFNHRLRRLTDPRGCLGGLIDLTLQRPACRMRSAKSAEILVA